MSARDQLRLDAALNRYYERLKDAVAGESAVRAAALKAGYGTAWARRTCRDFRNEVEMNLELFVKRAAKGQRP